MAYLVHQKRDTYPQEAKKNQTISPLSKVDDDLFVKLKKNKFELEPLLLISNLVLKLV